MISLLYKHYGAGGQCLHEYLCDRVEDVEDLPIDICSGSTAYVCSIGWTYVLNNNHEWIRRK